MIVFVSLYPINESSNSSNNDKLYHFITYLLLSLPVSIRKPSSYIYIYIYFILFGGFIELIQPYFNRYNELADFIANSLGVVVGAASGLIIRKIIL